MALAAAKHIERFSENEAAHNVKAEVQHPSSRIDGFAAERGELADQLVGVVLHSALIVTERFTPGTLSKGGIREALHQLHIHFILKPGSHAVLRRLS